jgi:hypothetical protein
LSCAGAAPRFPVNSAPRLACPVPSLAPPCAPALCRLWLSCPLCGSREGVCEGGTERSRQGLAGGQARGTGWCPHPSPLSLTRCTTARLCCLCVWYSMGGCHCFLQSVVNTDCCSGGWALDGGFWLLVAGIGGASLLSLCYDSLPAAWLFALLISFAVLFVLVALCLCDHCSRLRYPGHFRTGHTAICRLQR